MLALLGAGLLALGFLFALVDLVGELLGPGGLFEDRDIRIIVGLDSDFFGDALQQLQHLGIFLFGEEIDLEIKVTAALIEVLLAIFGDHDESGEEDGLKGDDEGEEAKGKWVELGNGQDGVPDDPQCEPGDVKPDETHGSAKAGDAIGDAVSRGEIPFFRPLQLSDGFDVLGGEFLDGSGRAAWLGCAAAHRP